MKNVCFIVIFSFLCASLASAQCNNSYYNLEKGREFELTNYDKKGKAVGKSSNKIIDVEASGSEYRAIISSTLYDKKDKVIHEGEYEIICEGDKVKLDINQFFPTETMQAYENMNVEFEGDALVIPASLEVGEELPGGKSTMSVKAEGSDVNLTSADMEIMNRKVVAKEEVTTPAGTFSCYKVTYDTNMEMKVMGIKKKMENTTATWFAEGVGMVKSESYDKKGQLESYTLLTDSN